MGTDPLLLTFLKIPVVFALLPSSVSTIWYRFTKAQKVSLASAEQTQPSEVQQQFGLDFIRSLSLQQAR